MKVANKFEHIFSNESWLVKETSWERADQNSRESRFTLGNGYMCSRGVLEEIPYGAQPGTFIAGLYDKTGSQVTELINLPNPINFRIIVGGEKIDVLGMNVISHNRTLDMQKGLLARKTVYSSAEKRHFDYQSLRFLSMSSPHIGVMQIHFTPLDADCNIMAETFVDTSISNADILSEGRKRHVEVTKFLSTKTLNYRCVRTFEKKVSVGFATHLRLRQGGKIRDTSEKILQLFVKKGETITFTRFFAIHTSRDVDFRGWLERRTITSLNRAVKAGFSELLKQHVAAWKRLWNLADIDIRPDTNLQTALRFNVYHLLICANRNDNRSSIPARTLSGEGYRGHVFWDTEIFILPFFIYTQPKIAKNLLYYRYRTLPAARRNARLKGYKGALFAWESADTGQEATPGLHRDLDGRIIRIHTGELEHHIVADIAYAVSHYYAATGDRQFMLEAGLEMIFECARFWASRVSYNKRRDRYSIKGVIGPDEFHVKVNDNAFTNLMARWNLVRATQVYREYETLNARQFKQMAERIKLMESEIRNWARISNRMTVRVNKDEIIESFSGFFKRKYVPIRDLDKNFMPALPKDIPVRRIKTTQFVKQADALMLFHLFPDSYPLSQRKKNFIYYDKRTLHKSSLSPSIHALTGWEAGERDKAFFYFVFSLYADLEDKHGNTDNGMHAAALGGNWQVVFHAFAGIRVLNGLLSLNPSLPPGITTIHLKTFYLGELIKIRINKRKVTILPLAHKNKRLKIAVYGKIRILKGGRQSVFERPHHRRA